MSKKTGWFAGGLAVIFAVALNYEPAQQHNTPDNRPDNEPKIHAKSEAKASVRYPFLKHALPRDDFSMPTIEASPAVYVVEDVAELHSDAERHQPVNFRDYPYLRADNGVVELIDADRALVIQVFDQVNGWNPQDIAELIVELGVHDLLPYGGERQFLCLIGEQEFHQRMLGPFPPFEPLATRCFPRNMFLDLVFLNNEPVVVYSPTYEYSF